MRRIWTCIAPSLLLTAIAAPAPLRATPLAGGPPAPVARVAAAASVTGLSIVPGTAGAEVVISVDGAVKVQDFTLADPSRVVLDLSAATLAAAPRLYDKVSRAGIVNVRMAQYRPDVVRIVLDLESIAAYEVSTNEGSVRLVLSSKASDFAAWSTGEVTPVRDVATAEAAPRMVNRDASAAERPFVTSSVIQAQAQQQPRITVTYQNADINDVIAAFATFAGRTIVVGKNVQGTVTAEIRDQPWDVALRAILRSQGLAAREDAETGIIVVDSYQNLQANVSTQPLATQMVRLNYARAASLLPTVQGLLSRDCRVGPGTGGAAGGAAALAEGGPVGGGACVTRGNVVADSGTNALLITDVPTRIDELMGYISALDIRTPQVALKAKIIFVNRSEIEDLGLRYDLGTGTEQFFSTLVQRIDPSTRKPVDTNGDGVPDALGGGTPFTGNRISLGGNALSAIANANATVANPTLSLVFSTALGRFDLTAFVDALQEVRLADLQAEPSIVTLDNRPAEIFSGQDIPFRQIDAGAAAGGATPGTQAARAVTQIVQAGIRLTVTPHITNNRQVLLTLSAENSDAQIAASDVGFIINRQRANNELLVADGETAVIGGLTVTQVTSSRIGIPLLVDLPFIGRFFGQTRTQEDKRDLLILITPHIVDEGDTVPAPRAPGSP